MAHFIVTIEGKHLHLLIEKIEPDIPLNQNPVYMATFDGHDDVFFESEGHWEIWDIVDHACAIYSLERNPQKTKIQKSKPKKISRFKNWRKSRWHDQ